MKVISINEHLTGFYFAGDSVIWKEDPAAGMDDNWSLGGCNSLGVCCYVLHKSGEALIYDTLCSPEQIGEVRAYLETRGISRFTVTLSHWHLDHVGGNNLFKDCPIIAQRKTRDYLEANLQAIENATLWGQPAIEPLRLPDIVFDNSLTVYCGQVEVQMHHRNIHSDDGCFVYLPAFKIMLAGDMLEDTCPFVTNPKDIAAHLKNLDEVAAMDIERILPNHGRSATIKAGGYSKELIRSAQYYLDKISQMVAKDPMCAVPPLCEFMAPYLENGTLGYWQPYEKVHEDNFARLKACAGA